MNMGAVAAKLGGMTAGLAVSGAIQKYLEGTANEGLKKTWGPLGMIALGVYGPSLAGGKGGDAISSACDAIMMKGLNTMMTKNFPNFLAGPDDDISGFDDTVAGYGAADDMIVSGPGDYDTNVSGPSNSDDVSGFIH